MWCSTLKFVTKGIETNNNNTALQKQQQQTQTGDDECDAGAGAVTVSSFPVTSLRITVDLTTLVGVPISRVDFLGGGPAGRIGCEVEGEDCGGVGGVASNSGA